MTSSASLLMLGRCWISGKYALSHLLDRRVAYLLLSTCVRMKTAVSTYAWEDDEHIINYDFMYRYLGARR